MSLTRNEELLACACSDYEYRPPSLPLFLSQSVHVRRPAVCTRLRPLRLRQRPARGISGGGCMHGVVSETAADWRRFGGGLTRGGLPRLITMRL